MRLSATLICTVSNNTNNTATLTNTNTNNTTGTKRATTCYYKQYILNHMIPLVYLL